MESLHIGLHYNNSLQNYPIDLKRVYPRSIQPANADGYLSSVNYSTF